MSETKFTPGPWFVKRQNPSPTTGEWMIAGSKPGYLAEIRDCGSGDVQANAHLIAAAPELYNFVEEYLEAWENGMAGDSYLFYLAQAVRGKARGEA